MKEYRLKMLLLLDKITFLVDKQYMDFEGQGLMPANPELYTKPDWEETNETIEEIVFNYMLPSIDYILKENDDLYLTHVKTFLESVGWEEI